MPQNGKGDKPRNDFKKTQAAEYWINHKCPYQKSGWCDKKCFCDYQLECEDGTKICELEL